MFLADVSCPAASRPCADESVSRVVQSLSPSLVVFAGDVQYPSHSLREYERSFLPVWGAVRDRALAVPGNHEYLQAGAAGYFAAWGESGGTGRFSTTIGGWRIIGINTSDGCREVSCAEAGEQYVWLEDLLRAEDRCTIVVGHHPRWSSGTHGATKALASLWDLLERYNVEAYVAGHDHHYERVAGHTTQYVVGTGGADLRPASSQGTVVVNAHGALAMALSPGAASVRFESLTGPQDQHELLCS
jgi:alkaline phosphatase